MNGSLCFFNEKENILYINSDSIVKEGLSIKETLSYMRKPYSERIADSPYKEDIEAELRKHPGCKISEFCDPGL